MSWFDEPRTHADWQQLLQSGLTRRALTRFHARYKYLLMAHNPAQYKTLGKLLGSMANTDATQLGPQYFSQLIEALKHPASRGNHTNVLLHLSGYLRKSISVEDRQEIRQSIDLYHKGAVPLMAPIALLKRHLRQHPDPYLLQQVYLHQHPDPTHLQNVN